MTIEETAKKIRQAIFDRAEDEGRVMHASSMEDEIIKVLKEAQPKSPWGYGAMTLGGSVVFPAHFYDQTWKLGHDAAAPDTKQNVNGRAQAEINYRKNKLLAHVLNVSPAMDAADKGKTDHDDEWR